MRFWKAIIVLVLVIALGGAGVYLWRSQGSSGAQTADLTEVMTVVRGDLTASVSPTGEVYAPHQAQLSFDVSRIELIELNVVAGQEVKEGAVLARIDPGSLERAVEQAEADLLSAEEQLEAAQSPVTELDLRRAKLAVTQAETALEQAREKVSDLQITDSVAAERAVSKAEYNLEIAQINVTLVEYSTTVRKNVRDGEYTVDWHERKLRDLEAQYLQGLVDQDTVEEEREALAAARDQLADADSKAADALEAAHYQVTQAEEALVKAEAALAELEEGPTALEVEQANDQVAQAEYNLNRAQEELAQLEAGPSANEIELAQARYEAAEATLEEAKANLEAATMLAPFDATVVSVGAGVGDLVSSGTMIVSLADLTELRVRASVDETDISQVEVGQPVRITFDSLPGLGFQGQVLEIPLEGTLSQSIVTYEVPISLEGAEDAELKSGMTANLEIIVGQRENVLLLPLLAVQQGDVGEVVLVQDSPEEEAVQVPVEVGLNDGTYVEVLRGLNEGDQVVVQYETSEEVTGFGLRRNSGGIMGGGMRLIP